MLHSRINETLLLSSAALNRPGQGIVLVSNVQVSSSVEFGPVIAWDVVSCGLASSGRLKTYKLLRSLYLILFHRSTAIHTVSKYV